VADECLPHGPTEILDGVASIYHQNGMQTTIDKAGRVVIPASIREAAGFGPGTALEVRLEGGEVRLVRDVPGPELVRVGGRLVARPRAAGVREVDIAGVVEAERDQWPW
jgi:AbrB family looped-hinge helix DNA binding protein